MRTHTRQSPTGDMIEVFYQMPESGKVEEKHLRLKFGLVSDKDLAGMLNIEHEAVRDNIINGTYPFNWTAMGNAFYANIKKIWRWSEEEDANLASTTT